MKIVFERYSSNAGPFPCAMLDRRLVDIILEKMSDAPEDPSGGAQGNNAYGNQAGAYNKGTTRLAANDQQAKGNPCQC